MAAHQASPSLGFSRQEHWSGLPFPSPMHASEKWKWSHFSRVRLCVTPWTAAHQAPLSLGFSRQEHWSGLPFPSPMHESEKQKWSLSVVSNSSVTPWAAAYQAPPSMGFSRQEYWSGVPIPPLKKHSSPETFVNATEYIDICSNGRGLQHKMHNLFFSQVKAGNHSVSWSIWQNDKGWGGRAPRFSK